jgi:hypothetical protein
MKVANGHEAKTVSAEWLEVGQVCDLPGWIGAVQLISKNRYMYG